MVKFEELTYVTRVTIPRTDLPKNNVALSLAIIGTLTANNGPVTNSEEELMFAFNSDIPKKVLFDFLTRWGVNLEGSEWI